MTAGNPERCYYIDTNAIIALAKTGPGRQKLEDLGKRNELRILEAVEREAMRRKETKTARWVREHKRFVMRATEAVAERTLALASTHGRLFTNSPGAADPELVAAAVLHRDREPVPTVLSDDTGVQAVCLIENVPYATVAVFQRIFGI